MSGKTDCMQWNITKISFVSMGGFPFNLHPFTLLNTLIWVVLTSFTYMQESTFPIIIPLICLHRCHSYGLIGLGRKSSLWSLSPLAHVPALANKQCPKLYLRNKKQGAAPNCWTVTKHFTIQRSSWGLSWGKKGWGEGRAVVRMPRASVSHDWTWKLDAGWYEQIQASPECGLTRLPAIFMGNTFSCPAVGLWKLDENTFYPLDFCEGRMLSYH